MTSFEHTTLSEKIDTAIEAVLYGLLAFMPFAFGVVHAWSELIFILAAVVLIGLQMAKWFVAKTKPVLTWALVPVAVFILVPVFQLIPLPAGVVKTISPNTYQVKTDLLSKLPVIPTNTEEPVQTTSQENGASVSTIVNRQSTIDNNKMQLSFYSYATWHGLRLVLSVAAIFFVTLQYFTTIERVKRLLACIAIIGGAVAILAILQDITRAEKIYWTFSSKYKMATAGPFVNYSNFSQFMNLSMGAALALAFILLHEAFDKQQTSLSFVANYMSTPAARPVWLLIGMVLLGITSVFASMSRAGMISLLTAGAITTIALTTRKSLKGRGWLMAFMALGAFICVLYVGFDAVYERLATLGQLDQAQGGRVQIIKDIAVAWSQFPVFGTGLDTHAVVYPMFDRATISALAAHADSDYAQAFEEVGLLGVVSLLVFAGMIAKAYWTNIQTAHVPLRSAAYGLGFGLIAILIHSGTDFGQHLPANATLTVIFCALLIVFSRKKFTPTSLSSEALIAKGQAEGPVGSNLKTSNINLYTAIAVSGILAVILLWLVFSPRGAWAAKRAEKAYVAAGRSADFLETLQAPGSTAQYADLLRNAQTASELQPANIEYRHWLNVWRWESMSRYTDPNGLVLLPPQAMPHVRRLVAEYTNGLKTCPTYGPSWTVAGQLLYFILEPQGVIPNAAEGSVQTSSQSDSEILHSSFSILNSQGASMIRTGYKLAPYDATVCFVNGLLDVEEYKKAVIPDPGTSESTDAAPETSDEVGYTYFARAIELDPGYFDDIAQVYLSINRPDLAVRLASDNISRLNALARQMTESEQYSDAAQAARDRVIKELEKQANAADIQPWTLASLASIYAQDGRLDEAAALYTRALTHDYGNIPWRLGMARCLAGLGQTEQAIHQCRIILRLNPTYAPAKRLIEQLSIQPVTTNP